MRLVLVAFLLALGCFASPAHAKKVACDIGPPATIPPEAAQAGLTHCVANFDFSQRSYAVPAFDHTGRAGSWANCMGENNNIPSIIWHGGASGIPEVSPCDIKQKTDPLDGSTVMNFEWRPEPPFYKGGANANGVSLMTFNQYSGVGRGTPTVTFGNYYIEETSRIEQVCPSSACPPNAGGPSDVYVYPTPGYYGTEIDINEFQTNQMNNTSSGVAAGNCGYSNGGNPCWTNWSSNWPIVGVPNYSNTVYHSYGALSTSDGVTDKRVCMYIDDVLQVSPQGCLVEAGSGVGVPDTNFLTRNMLIVGASSGAGSAGQPIEFNVKSIIVWSCANYNQSGAAGMCNGTTLRTSKLPTGQTLSYYHRGP